MSRSTLEAARNLIANAPRLAQHVYNTGKLLAPGTCYCTMGAIAALEGRDYPDLDDPVLLTLARALDPATIPHYTGAPAEARVPFNVIADWNDTKGRTREDVLALFDKVISNEKAAS